MLPERVKTLKLFIRTVQNYAWQMDYCYYFISFSMNDILNLLSGLHAKGVMIIISIYAICFNAVQFICNWNRLACITCLYLSLPVTAVGTNQ
jgi:hypothetical protein